MARLFWHEFVFAARVLALFLWQQFNFSAQLFWQQFFFNTILPSTADNRSYCLQVDMKRLWKTLALLALKAMQQYSYQYNVTVPTSAERSEGESSKNAVSSHEVMAAMLVSLNKETAASLVSPINPLDIEFNYHLFRWKNKVTHHVSANLCIKLFSSLNLRDVILRDIDTAHRVPNIMRSSTNKPQEIICKFVRVGSLRFYDGHGNNNPTKQ